MAQLYTAGEWLVKEGKDDEFVAAWHDLAAWTLREAPGSGWGRLLRDRDDPRRYLSFGPWESIEAIEAWRDSDGFRQRFGRLRELLDDVRPRTLELVAEQQRA